MSYLIQNIKTTNDLKEKLYTVSKKWLLEHILYKDIKPLYKSKSFDT